MTSEHLYHLYGGFIYTKEIIRLMTLLRHRSYLRDYGSPDNTTHNTCSAKNIIMTISFTAITRYLIKLDIDCDKYF